MKKKKKKSADETLKIIEEILDYNKSAQTFFSVASKVDKEKSKPEEIIVKMVKLRREKIAEIDRKEKKHNALFSYSFDYSNPSNMHNKLISATSETNKNRVDVIIKQLTKLKNRVKNVPKNDKLKSEENRNIIHIVEKILELNNENQLGLGLKILTPNQMLSRLPISLAQLKAGNNSKKLKNEIRQLLHSLYRSKNLQSKLYKRLIDII